MHAASRHPPARASSRPGLDLADIVRDYGPAYREAHAISPEQAAVLRDIARCRTAALGGHRSGAPRGGGGRPPRGAPWGFLGGAPPPPLPTPPPTPATARSARR